MPSSAPSDPLEQLEQIKKAFGTEAALRIPGLIEQAADRPFTDIQALIRFHETLLFLRAYPHCPRVYAKAEEILARFPEFTTALRTHVADLSPLEEGEVSGIAGVAFSALFSFGTVSRLVQLYPAQLEIDWDWYEDSAPMGRILPRFLPLLDEDSAVEAYVPHRVWLESAVPRGSNTLEWLLEQFNSLDLPLEEKAELYDSLGLIVKWNLDRSGVTRTQFRLPAPEPFYHDGPLIQRRDISLEKEFEGPPLPVTLLSHSEGRAFLDAALAASAVRYRELHGFTFGDPAKVWKADAGRGIQIYLAGVSSEFRLPLRACHSAMMVKNGVPVGYFEGLSLFDRIEVGFNLYYTFRDGETAWLFARLLHLCRQLLGVTTFSIHPYQIGCHNDEAIESGAFWFYRKLGFRPVEAGQAAIVAREEKKLRARTAYRTPPRTLLKIAEDPLLYDADGARTRQWDGFQVRNIGLAVQLAMAAAGGDSSRFKKAASQSLMRILGARPSDSLTRAFQKLAPPLVLIEDLARWTPAEKNGLLQIVRAKAGPDERRYLTLMQKHDRLREAFQRRGKSLQV